MIDSRLGLLAEYGFNRDVFAPGYVRMETVDVQRTKRITTMAIDSRAMIEVIGPRGHGKTEAIAQALADRNNVVEVRLLSGEKEAVKIGDIERALVLDLNAALGTDEGVKRTREVRARQMRRMLGEAAKGKNKSVVLVLEEAHRMHGSTLRSLKTMREMAWMGMCPLMTIIMVCQWDPFRNNPSVDEVRLRTDKIEMKGLTPGEVKEYLGHTVGAVFEADAAEAVTRVGASRNFLELQELLCNLMAAALRHGHKKVKAIDVFATTGGGLKEIIKQTGLSQAEIAREAGISTTEVSQLVNDKPGTTTQERTQTSRRAILEVVARKLREKNVVEETAMEAAG